MKRNVIKILTILVFFIYMLLYIHPPIAMGESGESLVKKFDGKTDAIKVDNGEKLVKNVLDITLSATRIVATGVALIMLTFLGIKYMSAAPSEKANIKNQLITYTLGAAVIVGTTRILEIIKNFAERTTK